MIIISERKFDPRRRIKTPQEAADAFEYIKECFIKISGDFESLSIMFLSSDWYLKEGYSESMRIYNEAVTGIRKNLKNLEGVIVTLRNFLISENRIIPLHPDAPQRTNKFIVQIEKAVKEYLKETKGKTMPFPSEEIKRAHVLIQNINQLIAQINEINAGHGVKPVGLIKTPNL